MKTFKKTMAVALAVVMLAMTFTGCAKTEPLPETTSEELGVFVLNGKFVDKDGKELSGEDVPGYSFDEDGNVVIPGEKKNKTVVVLAADKVADFTCASEVAFDEEAAKQNIPLYALSDDSEVYGDCTWEMTLNVGPADTVNGGFTVASADPNTLCFADGEESKSFDEAGEVILELTARYPGDAKLTVSNCLGEIIGTIDFTVEPEAVEEEEAEEVVEEIEKKIAVCEHQYKAFTVQPTETSGGYTQHTCTLCGHVYRDSFTEKLPCSHTYSERKVNATCTEKGYTLCTCTKCGDVTKKDYTELAPHSYKDEVVAPTCTAKGYTKHTCSVCGHSHTDSYVDTIAHKYNQTVVEPTCSVEGYTVHTCTVCGTSYTDNKKPTLPHTYVVNTVAPTYTEQGYTLHTCSVCGDSFKDSYVDKLVCTNHNHTETGRTEPTCTEAGTISKKCSICGASTTETVAPLGHKYTESVTAPTCEEGGCTAHTCSVCGHTYTDTQTPALGHDWEAHEGERVVIGQECHTFCSACGLDFTANGMGNGGAHQKAHALAGEKSGSYQAYVDIYGEDTIYICRRCGATR